VSGAHLKTLAIGLLFAWVPVAALAASEEETTFQLSKTLYFDCTVWSDHEPGKKYELDISYLLYPEQPGAQVNFRDPSKLVSTQTGWAPKDHFVFSRQIADRELFIWKGRTDENSFPYVTSTFELAPKPDDASRVTLSMARFMDTNARTVSVERFKGECGSLSGKAAWDRYQNGDPK
jgi:hypothetical protein